MIQEDYCSYEVAKLLKEKGFDEPCIAVYEEEVLRINTLCDYYNSKLSSYVCAPTHQMAMKWLREKHNIDIDIEAAVGMLGVKVYIPFISTYKPFEDAPSKVRQIKRGIYYKDDRGVIPALRHFDSYEEAVEASLKFVLENLI